jgi:ribosome-binding protein aMBF1 (putative translation factor)
MRLARDVRGDGSFWFHSEDKLMATKKCPVCDWEIKEAGIAVKTGGKELTVCCDDCAKKVQENPANYTKTAK